MPAVSAADLGIPDVFNAASWFLDRHVAEGRGQKVALECGDVRMTYADVQQQGGNRWDTSSLIKRLR